MDLKITGNPGENNKFHETHMDYVQNNAPNAKEIYNYNFSGKSSRYVSRLQRLAEEIRGNIKEDVFEDLLFYNTKLDGTKGLEEKLTDGHFGKTRITVATRQKEMYAKKATKYECYPSAQQINFSIFGRIKNDFDTYVSPLIETDAPLKEIMKVVREKIVSPIMEIIENGANDEYLQYTSDHIYGMIYYLTGMCHLNWKDYDNV